MGSYVHSVSKDVCYYAISSGSLSCGFYYTKAIVFGSGASSASLLFSAGYLIHLGDVSISKSLEASS